ncbi:MAG: radical SAM/SPASM domain-containing protein [Fibrobacterota bacterium]|nr:radical SAM protein [Chitinispirillaceae bacterium]
MGIKRRISRVLPIALRKKILSLIGQRSLFSQLPLSMPLVIHIDPSNVCNFKCIFCPTADTALLRDVNRPRQIMSMECFKKIVDDITSMKKLCRGTIYQIHLYKDGEPLLNKALPEMIRYIKDADVANCISTTSNGSLLDKDCAEKIIDSGLDMIRISVESTDNDGYRRITQTDTTYETIVENVTYLYHLKKKKGSGLYITVKITDVNLQDEQKEKFRRDFTPIADQVRIDTLMGWSYSQKKDFTLGANVTTGIDGETLLKKRIVCPEPFSKMAVNSDGSVSMCCVDWSQGTVVGNVAKNSIFEIWNSEQLRQYRLLHSKNKRHEIPPCNDCQYLCGFPPCDDLDKFGIQLVSMYKS